MKEIIYELLTKPLWQMSGEEFCQLLEYTLTKYPGGKEAAATHRIYGAANLAEYLGCCFTKINLCIIMAQCRDVAMGPSAIYFITFLALIQLVVGRYSVAYYC